MRQKQSDMNRNILICAFLSLILFSCGTQKETNQNLYSDCIKMDLYEVVDSSRVDSLIQKARLEHKRITGCFASCFEFIQTGNPQQCRVYSSSFYIALSTADETSRTLGFSLYNDDIILINKEFSPNIFSAKGEDAYVVLLSTSGKDYTVCVFDSTYHFLESENAIVEIR